ncbi:MAG TPA: hypothetical protein PKN99_13010, partial [Cyclobacteriaceae bacterium]|nr:hypothetical protein [Cyclobacteriaceae bacterium]
MDANDFMNLILNPKVQEFIKLHESDDVNDFVLRNQSIHGIPTHLIAQQIIARQKAKVKLPELYFTSDIVYPPSINLEQSSSQATAQFKRTLFSGKSLIDLTGGFGIDSYYFSKSFNKVKYVETNKFLFNLVQHNHLVLKADTILHINSTAEEFLSTNQDFFDLCYIDPSRRNSSKKVIRLTDCEPNIIDL